MSSDPLYDIIAIYRKKRYWLRKYLFHAVTTYNGIAPKTPGMIIPQLEYDESSQDPFDFPVPSLDDVCEPFENLNINREPIVYVDKPLVRIRFRVISNPMAKHPGKAVYSCSADAPSPAYYLAVFPQTMKMHVVEKGYDRESLALALHHIHASCLEAYRHFRNIRRTLDIYLRDNIYLSTFISSMYDRMSVKFGLLPPPKFEFSIPQRIYQLHPTIHESGNGDIS